MLWCAVRPGRWQHAHRHRGPALSQREGRFFRDRYEIDPAEVARILREARALGLDIIGFYHSHPDHPAYWSPTDFEDAYWLGCSYVITSVDDGKAKLTRSFALTGNSVEDKAFVEEELVTEP